MPVSPITSEMLYSKEHLSDPYPLWERMRHDMPVFFDEITKTWVLTRYTDCVEAFANYKDFSNTFEFTLQEVGFKLFKREISNVVNLKKN